MDVWDASLPGAGARRATTILQVYMRMGNYSPLSILVADSLCLTFKSDGATVAELGAYLGLTQDRVEIGINGMPREVYCTSLEFSHGDEYGENEQQRKDGAEKEWEGTSGIRKETQDTDEGGGMRYYINYATFLPFAYAHGSHMLLALCQLPLPKRVEGTVNSGELSNISISPNLRRVDCRSGLCCVNCRYWMGLWDLRSTIVKCPLCQADILDGILRDIRSRYNNKLADGRQLLVFGPVQQRQPCPQQRSGESAENTKGNAPKVGSDDTTNYPLARDPFLVQQALFFKFLYLHPFVCVNVGSFAVDADEVMTREEYAHRSKHKATVLDQFRLVHRNPSAIRVHLVDQVKVDEEKYAQAAKRLAKRVQLPPWLQSADLSSSATVLKSLLALRRTEERTGGSKRTRRDRDVTSIASYVAREFFDDDFVEIPLRREFSI
ncbi:TFIIH basal transcription factor subunit [Trypanosoma equiperdum]|uniref:TFIIH basal transcription factor subunit n=2 Tax=Trypanozoon TaxID=39700 RepID=Q382C6_TRYB2|nr:hypothetical protein, conserved [Trypanosoma brucei brucei TREU927]EAN80355.1 hypothetical protein, conserved [Trypanosoma brucei brucei TREU927]SCU73077.1 TFIIH basal transcription factor subunit [Trypanosoma equiperdum]